MTGVILTTSIDMGAARTAFLKLSHVMADTTPVMRAIGTGLVENTQTRFEREQSPEGAKWAPLNVVYASTKKGAGILRGSAMRGGLQGSITYRAGSNTVEVGSNKIYAGVHQFGATIRPKSGAFLVFRMGGRLVKARSVTIPARPYLGIGPEDAQTILDVVETALDQALASGASSARGKGKAR